MKVIIAGSRNIKKFSHLEEAMKIATEKGLRPTQIVSGGARGVDTMGETWAVKNGVEIRRFPAEWERFGISAGHRRNRQMGDYADALVALWDGESKGTKGMIDYAKEKRLLIFVFIINKNGEFHATIDY